MPQPELQGILQKDFSLVPEAIVHPWCLQMQRACAMFWHRQRHAQVPTCQLQAQVLSVMASAEEKRIGERRPEPECHTEWPFPEQCALIVGRQVDEVVGVGAEGESGGDGAGGAVEAGLALAQVSMSLCLVGGDAQGLVLALVILAARQLHRAVLPTPGCAVEARPATTEVVGHSILTGPAVLTGLIFTLICVYGTLHTWQVWGKGEVKERISCCRAFPEGLCPSTPQTRTKQPQPLLPTGLEDKAGCSLGCLKGRGCLQVPVGS